MASTSNNYWALIPVPGAGLVGSLATKDQDELGLWNRNSCWTMSCLDQKIAITEEARAKYCEDAGAAGEPA